LIDFERSVEAGGNVFEHKRGMSVLTAPASSNEPRAEIELARLPRQVKRIDGMQCPPSPGPG